MSEVDLTKCKPGDVCVDRAGTSDEYISPSGHPAYRHRVGGHSYTDNGRFLGYKEHPWDIVRVIPAGQNTPNKGTYFTMAGKPKKKQPKWRVVIECVSRKHARQVKDNVDNGLRGVIKIERGDK